MNPEKDGESAQVPAAVEAAARPGHVGDLDDDGIEGALDPEPSAEDAALEIDVSELTPDGELSSEELLLEGNIEELEPAEMIEEESGPQAPRSAAQAPPLPGLDGSGTTQPVAATGDERRAGGRSHALPPARPSGEILEALRDETAAQRLEALRSELAAEQLPWRRAVLEHEIGVLLAARDGEEGGAAEAWGRALVEDPSLKPNLWALRRLCEGRGDWPSLGALLIAEARAEGGPRERAQLYVERGHLLADHMGDEAGAEDAWRTALAEDPSSLQALMALERRAIRGGDEAAQRALLRQMADATGDPGRRTELLVELARMEAALDDGRPFELLREALGAGAAPGRVLGEAQRLAEERSDGAELLATLEQRVRVASAATGRRADEQVVDLRRWQATIQRATEPQNARACLEAGLERVPGDPLLLLDLAELAVDEGRHDDAALLFAALETKVSAVVARRVALARGRSLRLAGREEEAAQVELSVGDALEVRALRCVERQEYAAAAGDIALLAAACHEEAGLALAVGDERWAARALGACASLRERLGEDEGAIEAWRAAMAACPDDAVALSALDVALDRRRLHAERAQVLERRLGIAGPGEAAGLLEDLVELRFHRLGDTAAASAVAEALCRLRANEGGIAEAAARSLLVEIERAAGRWPEVAAQLQRLASALREGGAITEAVDAGLWRADVLEHRLGDRAGAATAVEEALRAAPDHEAAHAERRRLLAEAGDWEGVASSLRAEVAGASEPSRLARLLVDLAQILEGRLGRPEEAAAVWRELGERAPDRVAPPRPWRRSAGAGPGPAALAQQIEAAVEVAPEGERAGGWLRAGELREDGVGDAGAAATAYGRALALGGEVAPHAAFGLYRAVARSGDEVLLDGAIEGLARFADGGTAAALSEERAAIAARSGDIDAARARLDEAIGHDPTRLSARLAQARLAVRAGQPERLGETLAALAAHTSDQRFSSVAQLRGAVLAAATHQGGSVELPPPSSAAAEALDQATHEVVRSLAGDRGRAEGAWGTGDVAAVEMLLASGRLAEAAAALEGPLTERPRDVMLLDAARRIARAGGDRPGEARAVHALAAAVANGDRAVALFEEAARSLEALGERVEATLAWRSLVSIRPDEETYLHRATALLEELGDQGAIEGLLDERVDRAATEGARHALLIERGLLRARTGRPRAAAEDLETVLGAAPDEPRALEALASLRADAGDRTGAAFLLERRLGGSVGEAMGPVSAADRPLLLRLLDLYQGVGSVDGIRRTLRRLQADSEEDAPIRSRAAELLERFGDAAGAIEQVNLMVRLERDGATRARLELRAAVIHRDSIGDLPAARAALARALAIDPLQLDALSTLLPLCVQGDDLQLRDASLKRAARAAQARIDADPESPDGYAALERILDWQVDDDGRQLAMQAAAAIAGQPIPPRRGGLEPSRALSSELYDRAFAAEAWGPALSIWRDTHEAAQRLLGIDLASLGVSRTTRVNERGVPAAWQAVDRIARAVGVESYALHAVGGPGDICATVGDALVLGSAFADAPGPDERFQVTRKLVLLRDRLGPLEGATDESLELFFAACAGVAEARWSEARHLDADRVGEWTRIVDRTLDRRARKALQEQAPQFAELSEVGTWRRAVLAGANRIALAVAGDLSAALSELRLNPSSAAGRSLLRFAVSDDMSAMRRALGLRS